MALVVDASAVVAILLQQPSATRLRRRFGEADSLHAPHLLDLEVAQVLRRAVLRGSLSSAEGEQALLEHTLLRIVRYPHQALLERVWQLKANVSAYDAAYLVLAEALAAPLLTLDGRLARAPGHAAEVELYA